MEACCSGPLRHLSGSESCKLLHCESRPVCGGGRAPCFSLEGLQCHWSLKKISRVYCFEKKKEAQGLLCIEWAPPLFWCREHRNTLVRPMGMGPPLGVWHMAGAEERPLAGPLKRILSPFLFFGSSYPTIQCSIHHEFQLLSEIFWPGFILPLEGAQAFGRRLWVWNSGFTPQQPCAWAHY